MALIDNLIGVAIFLGFMLFIISKITKKPLKEMFQEFMEKIKPAPIIEEQTEKII